MIGDFLVTYLYFNRQSVQKWGSYQLISDINQRVFDLENIQGDLNHL